MIEDIWDTEPQEVGCPKLVVDGGLRKCSVYQDRPQVCVAYNCLVNANKFNIDMPPEQSLAGRVRAAVMEVHGVDIETSSPA